MNEKRGSDSDLKNVALTQEELKILGAMLRERFQEVMDEPIPQEILNLLDKIERVNRDTNE